MVKVQMVVNKPIFENTFVVYEEESRQGFVVDLGGSCIDVMGVLERYRISAKFKLYTHLHLDHIAGGNDLAGQLSLPAYAHDKDLYLFDSLEQTADFLGYPPVLAPEIDGYLNDGDEFEIGDTPIKVIHTPGHTPGGCSFLVGEHLLTGDSLFKDSIGRTDLPGGDMAELRKSLRKKLYTLPESLTVWPGHGDKTTLKHEKYNNPYITIDKI
jgi:glyoxylase-like metal-dependent hydrolase (beta-lactamase superfamily II)